jgi:uncharacterized membrane protein
VAELRRLSRLVHLRDHRWLNHKGAFNRVKESDRGLHWVNLFVLFTTALLPFPTAVVSDALQDTTSRTNAWPSPSTR